MRKELKDIPVCNEILYKKTAAKHNTSPKQVEELVNFVSKFIATKIKDGGFETVMLPGFGKFKPRPKVVQHINDKQVYEKIIK